MSLFKEFLKKDLDIFFNQNEFAQTLVINGKATNVIMDPDELLKIQIKDGGKGLEKEEYFFSIAKRDIQKRPRIGAIMVVGELEFRIVNFTNEDELYGIRIARNQ